MKMWASASATYTLPLACNLLAARLRTMSVNLHWFCNHIYPQNAEFRVYHNGLGLHLVSMIVILVPDEYILASLLELVTA